MTQLRCSCMDQPLNLTVDRYRNFLKYSHMLFIVKGFMDGSLWSNLRWGDFFISNKRFHCVLCIVAEHVYAGLGYITHKMVIQKA